MTQFIFVRHGETDWNKENRFRGVIDIPLNATGIAQAQRAAERLASVPIDAVYASPLGRTMRTAEIVAAPHNLPIQPRAELLDLNYGAWTGKLPSEVDPAEYAEWLSKPAEVQFPGGGSVPQLRAQVMELIAELSAQHPDQTVLLVSHDLVGKVLVCGLIGAESNAIHRIQQDNACINRFHVEAASYKLLTMNETAHLE